MSDKQARNFNGKMYRMIVFKEDISGSNLHVKQECIIRPLSDEDKQKFSTVRNGTVEWYSVDWGDDSIHEMCICGITNTPEWFFQNYEIMTKKEDDEIWQGDEVFRPIGRVMNEDEIQDGVAIRRLAL